ncbi:MAG: acyl-[acyl-carrier-protein]--UDP-N-acetylglucosamine O-acyltransferase [Planctomycetaceae bacterium]|nr:acyl-[acyl-carrier-protein]--UDP-N-acetylglucosamine O-acyltransferase [Planctomycetaceae bacterium]
MPHVHPTAIVDSKARLAADVQVGPGCIVGPEARLGPGTRLHSYVVIEGHTTLGARNEIFTHATLGQPPQDRKFDGSPTQLVIGDDNIFREHCTVHLATQYSPQATRIGSGNLFMASAHVAHDSWIGDRCVLAVNVMLGGHVHVHDHAIISGGAAIRHYVTVGRHAMIGGLAGVVHDVPPFMIADGHPARVRGANRVGMRRCGFEADEIDRVKQAYLALWGRRARKAEPIATPLARLTRRAAGDPLVDELCRFVAASASSGCGRQMGPERAQP